MNARIDINPEICHGTPVIRNTRVLVSNILADLAADLSMVDILENYPNISKEDIHAALDFSAELSQFETLSYEPRAI